MQKLLLILIVYFVIPQFYVFGQTASNKTLSVFPKTVETVDQKIDRIAQSNRIDARLFRSLIYAESTFKVNALSRKGAGCLTQLMPGTARRFGLVVNSQIDERFSSIDKCLWAGAKYLGLLLEMFGGDVRLALAAYNAGEGAVMKFDYRIPPYKETTQYVEKISALYYGQRGHAIALAYNQPLAQGWVNSLYASWRPARTVLSRPVLNLYSPVAVDPRRQTKLNAGGKKPLVTRLDDFPAKLRTESLSFW